MHPRRGDSAWSALTARVARAPSMMRTLSHVRIVRFCVTCAVVGLTALSIYWRFAPQSSAPCAADFYSDFQSAVLVSHGSAPYGLLADWIRSYRPGQPLDPFGGASCLSGILEFSYTPFFAWILTPFTWLPYHMALLMWDGANLLMLAGAIFAFLRAARVPFSPLHLILLTCAAVLASPLRFELYYAQADIFLLFFICLALWARLAEHVIAAGLLLAVACASEPALLGCLIFLLWKREIKLAAVMLMTSAALILAPFLWFGGKALQDMLVIWQFYANEYATTFTNDAPKGILLRLLTPNTYVQPLADAPGLVTPLWLLVAVVVVLVALKLVAPRPLRQDTRSLLDVGLIVAALLLISPWSENNHFTLLIMSFLAVYASLWQSGRLSSEARLVLAAFVAALLLFVVLGDPVQYALVARMEANPTTSQVYVPLAAVYLYSLLAISAVIVYSQRLSSGGEIGENAGDLKAFLQISEGIPLPTREHISRVHIIGGPGTGKTTLSRQIAALLDVSVFELDEIAGAGPAPAFRMQRSLARRVAEVEWIATLPGWVTEGSFLGWIEGLLRAADVIVWLDIPASVALQRVAVRHCQEYVESVAEAGSIRSKLHALRHPHIRHLVSFMLYTWRYYRKRGDTNPPQSKDWDSGWSLSHDDTIRELTPYHGKVVRCARTTDIAPLLDRIERGMLTLHEAAAAEHTSIRHTASEGKMEQHISAYAEMHKAEWIPGNYDENIYDPDGYDSFIWSLYKPVLMRKVRDLASSQGRMKYLDFACGTGRIFAEVEPVATEAVGLDVSPQMIEYARRKVPCGELRCGDILSEPQIVESDFDLITAFRFFLNTEPKMRQLVMRSLAGRLAGPNSRLIFNVHANGYSVDALQSLYQRLRGWGSANTMTYPQVRRLVEEADLEIESWYGFGLWPHRLYRGRVSKLVHWTDQRLWRVPALRWISHDMLFICRRASQRREKLYVVPTRLSPSQQTERL